MNWQRILCFFGLHAWGKVHEIPVNHFGERPWETWAHRCYGYVRYCACCKKKSGLRNLCLGPITKIS